MPSHSFTIPQGWKFVQPASEDERKSYYELRYQVLRKPWNADHQSTKDAMEDQSIHFLLTDDSGKAAATGRLQLNSVDQAQIRSMAVREDLRGRGIGSFMIDKIEEEASRRKIKSIILDARENALDFYLQNGYKIIADSYLLFGVIRHFRMQKDF